MELAVQFTEVTRCPESESEDGAWVVSGPNAVTVLSPGEIDTGAWSVTSGHTAVCQNKENFTVCEKKGVETKARWW